MKSVKGGTAYCQCPGGQPVNNPNDWDCMYVCTGTEPSYTGWSQNGSPSPGPSANNNPWSPPTPCVYTITIGNSSFSWSGSSIFC